MDPQFPGSDPARRAAVGAVGALAGVLAVVSLASSPVRAQPRAQAIKCRAPVAWRIGDVEAGFGLDAATLRRRVVAAADRWNRLSGRLLFVEDRRAGFTISLRYGQRQEVAKEIHGIQSKSERRVDRLGEMRAVLETLVRDYAAAAKAHRENVTGFNRAAAQFQARADAWQRRRGSEKARRRLVAEQAALKEIQTALAAARRRLEARRAEIVELEAAVNARIGQHNRAVTEANDVMQALPDQARQMGATHINGPSTRIVLYQVYDAKTLHVTLMHELGHALGILHTAEPASVMYAETNPRTPDDLTGIDLAAMRRLCGR